MKTITVIGILLVLAGGLVLAVQGFTSTRQEKGIDFGPIRASTELQERASYPPVTGQVVLVGGVILLVVGSRKRFG